MGVVYIPLVFARKVHRYLRLEDSFKIDVIMLKTAQSYTLISIEVWCTSIDTDYFPQQCTCIFLYACNVVLDHEARVEPCTWTCCKLNSQPQREYRRKQMTLKTQIICNKLTGKKGEKSASANFTWAHYLKRCYYIRGSEIATQLNMMWCELCETENCKTILPSVSPMWMVQ